MNGRRGGSWENCFMTRKFCFLILIVASVAAAASAQERFLRPVDDAKKDPSFLAFRTALIAAAERRDANYIYSIVDRNIKLGFGGEDGIGNFKKTWKLTNKDSEFWAEFLTVIKNGGAFSEKGRLFTAPYTFSSWPEDIDAFEYLAVFGNNVNLRDAPSKDGKVIGSLSYNIVRVDSEKSVMSNAARDEDRRFTWYKVTTLGGKEGFVSADFVRNSIDLRAGFEKVRGKWRMTFFLAGD